MAWRLCGLVGKTQPHPRWRGAQPSRKRGYTHILKVPASCSGLSLFWGQEGCTQHLWLMSACVLEGAFCIHFGGFSQCLFKGLGRSGQAQGRK